MSCYPRRKSLNLFKKLKPVYSLDKCKSSWRVWMETFSIAMRLLPLDSQYVRFKCRDCLWLLPLSKKKKRKNIDMQIMFGLCSFEMLWVIINK